MDIGDVDAKALKMEVAVGGSVDEAAVKKQLLGTLDKAKQGGGGVQTAVFTLVPRINLICYLYLHVDLMVSDTDMRLAESDKLFESSIILRDNSFLVKHVIKLITER